VALRNSAPADFAVSLAALPSTRVAAAGVLGKSSVDVVLLLATDAVGVVRERLKGLGWPSKLVAYWGAGPGREVAAFDSLFAKVDAWVFGNPAAWEILGRPPKTLVIPDGGDRVHVRRPAVPHGATLPATGSRAVAADCGERIFAFLREVLAEGRARRRPNLSKEVTAFVSTVGAPTFEACVARLRGQDSSFRLQIIDHVAPMNAAFQRMLVECRTPYYVQVDEDMLLYPHAIRTLYETIARAGDNVAMYVADLYDVHLGRCILGVKIFRHCLVRRFPFEGNDAFETDQLERLAAAGYTYLQTTPGAAPVSGKTLGLHGTRWTLPSIYERYATLERRRRIYPSQMDWFEDYPALFLRRYLDDPSAENFFALQGILAGALVARHGEANAKDYRAYAELPGFGPLFNFLKEMSDAPQERRGDSARGTGASREGLGRGKRTHARETGKRAEPRQVREGNHPVSRQKGRAGRWR
jgi:hypothetical protein